MTNSAHFLALPPRRLRFFLVVAAVFLFSLTFYISEEPAIGFDLFSLLEILIVFGHYFLFANGLGPIRAFFDRLFPRNTRSAYRYGLEVLAVLAWHLALVTLLMSLPILLFMTRQVPNPVISRPEVVGLMFIHLYSFTTLVGLLMYLMVTAYYTFLTAYQTAQKAERLKRENVQEMFETLKNQVNPHFLFNSLNVLSVLIYRDKDQASRFVDELSLVYRYVLDHKDKELVALARELTFMEAYAHLLLVRYGETLEIELPRPEAAEALPYYLPPLTLQMLTDNALKHNVATRETPLRLVVQILPEGVLAISNRYQPRSVVDENLSGRLAYLANRYRFLTDKPLEHGQQDGAFTVRLPLLELE